MIRTVQRLALRLALVLLAGLPAARAGAADAPFLWQVKGPQALHYLVGSVHLLPESAYPLPPPFDAAYAATGGLVLESDLGELAAPETQSRMLREGLAAEGLRSEVGAALYQRTLQQVQLLELPAAACDRFKAWFCALTLSVIEFQRAGLDARFGLDQHFLDRAIRDQRSVGWLEEPEAQLSLFSAMPRELSKEFLASTLDDLGRPELRPEELVRLWRENDVAGLLAITEESRRRFPESYARLLSNRNRAWMEPLVKRIEGATPQMVVVGAAHLVGADGLVALLRARGYAVTAVPVPDAPPAAEAPLPPAVAPPVPSSEP